MNRFITDKNSKIVMLTSGAPKKALENFIGKSNLSKIEPKGKTYKATTKTGEVYYISKER